MRFVASQLPASRSLIRLDTPHGVLVAVWDGGEARALDRSLDQLLAEPHGELVGGELLDLDGARLLAPVESQEVWASGVTYERSRDARMEESETSADAYDHVYVAERPELFFKSAGWRVVAPGDAVGIRADSTWDVPEPELAVLLDVTGTAIAYAVANDMSSRSIEGESTLYLPQAKVYDRCAAIGPAAVLAHPGFDPRDARIVLAIERDGATAYRGETSTAQMVRDPRELCGVLRSSYSLPHGAWLMTGTGLVPDDFTLQAGDVVRIAIDGLGELVNPVVEVPHTGALAPSRAGADLGGRQA